MNVYSQLRSSTLGRALNSIKEDTQQTGQNLLGANVTEYLFSVLIVIIIVTSPSPTDTKEGLVPM